MKFSKKKDEEMRRSEEYEPAEEHPMERQLCRRLQNCSKQRHPQLKISLQIVK